jgi:hypothetical protein
MFIAEWSYWNSNQFGGSSCFAYDGRQVYCKCSLPVTLATGQVVNFDVTDAMDTASGAP